MAKRKAAICGSFAEPSDGLGPSTPPYLLIATVRNRWRRIPLVHAVVAASAACGFATRCPLIFPGPFHPLRPKWLRALADLRTASAETASHVHGLTLPPS